MRAREGFWWSEHARNLPKPVPNEKSWRGQRAFIVALFKLERKVRKKNPPGATKGWSNCRLCGCKNGSTTFEWGGWAWPDGLSHYVEAHNVRPSLAFQEFVLCTYLGA